MEATHIIKPEGFNIVELVEFIPSEDFVKKHGDDGRNFWINAYGKLWPISGPHRETSNEAIAEWNALFSKAPRGYSYE